MSELCAHTIYDIGTYRLLHHNFTQCISQPYSKLDTLLSCYIMKSNYSEHSSNLKNILDT